MGPPPPSQLPLTERLRPTRLEDLVGNPRARSELRAWADRWRSGTPPTHRAALLSGPAGVGKTTAALALAKEYGWALVEMNASDARNETAIDQVAGRASITHTLGGGPKGRGSHALILLDEADCLSGRLTETPRSTPEPVALREFLRGRYQTIEALNSAYGLSASGRPAAFEGWASIPRSPGNSAWTRIPPARRDLEEWKAASRQSDVSDRGGLAAMVRLVRSTRQPLILTVNDEWSLTRYSSVFRSGVARIRFYPIRDPEVRGRLEQISRSEGIALAPGALDAIVRRAHGDLRAALNDLDAISPLAPGPLQLSVLGSRDLSSDFATLTEEVLSSPRYYRSTEVSDRLDAPPDDLLPWIEENIPRFASDPAHRDAAFAHLAVAEAFLARARRERVWSLWSYASEVMTGGVGLALHEQAVPVSSGASFPQFLGEMGRSRGMRSVRDSLAAKAASRLHLSLKKSRESLLPFLEAILLPARGRRARPDVRRVATAIVRELELTPEEVAFLLGAEPDGPDVRALLGPEEREARSGPTESSTEPGSSPERATARSVQRHLSEFGR